MGGLMMLRVCPPELSDEARSRKVYVRCCQMLLRLRGAGAGARVRRTPRGAGGGRGGRPARRFSDSTRATNAFFTFLPPGPQSWSLQLLSLQLL